MKPLPVLLFFFGKKKKKFIKDAVQAKAD